MAERAPKVCIVQYNASRFLTRVDRSARTLAEAGCEVVLVAIKDAETPAFEEREGYTVRRVELKSRRLPRWTRPLRFVEAVWRTFSAAYAEDADVYNPRDIYPMFVCWLAAKLRGAKVVYDSDELNLERNWPWARQTWWRVLAKAYEGFYIRRAAAVITSDEGRADYLERVHRIPRPALVRNVPDVIATPEPDAEFRERTLKGKRYLLIYQGALIPNRGLPQLVSAMRLLDDCALVLVGFGHIKDALADQVGREALDDRVSIVDAVPFETMIRYTAAADIGVIPIVGSCLSYVYAAPNKLFEDMMVGVPVVASDLPDMAAVVRKERVGELIGDSTDPKQVAEAVRRLIDGAEPLAEVGARARLAALERYNWRIEREVLLGVYERIGVLSERSRKAAS